MVGKVVMMFVAMMMAMMVVRMLMAMMETPSTQLG